MHPVEHYLLFSDMPEDVRRRWDRQGVREVMRPSNKGNGLTYDADLNLLVCEHSTSSLAYDGTSRTGLPDPQVLEFVAHHRRAKGIGPREISREEIIDRCIYCVINEGAKELEEGIAIRASDIDVASVLGYGFPAHRGGPMHYGEEVGLKHIAATLVRFHERYGDPWRPSDLLRDLAQAGKGFADS